MSTKTVERSITQRNAGSTTDPPAIRHRHPVPAKGRIWVVAAVLGVAGAVAVSGMLWSRTTDNQPDGTSRTPTRTSEIRTDEAIRAEDVARMFGVGVLTPQPVTAPSSVTPEDVARMFGVGVLTPQPVTAPSSLNPDDLALAFAQAEFGAGVPVTPAEAISDAERAYLESGAL